MGGERAAGQQAVLERRRRVESVANRHARARRITCGNNRDGGGGGGGRWGGMTCDQATERVVSGTKAPWCAVSGQVLAGGGRRRQQGLHGSWSMLRALREPDQQGI
jgi:hypothetical protein